MQMYMYASIMYLFLASTRSNNHGVVSISHRWRSKADASANTTFAFSKSAYRWRSESDV
jgi:hypothetical protein